MSEDKSSQEESTEATNMVKEGTIKLATVVEHQQINDGISTTEALIIAASVKLAMLNVQIIGNNQNFNPLKKDFFYKNKTIASESVIIWKLSTIIIVILVLTVKTHTDVWDRKRNILLKESTLTNSKIFVSTGLFRPYIDELRLQRVNRSWKSSQKMNDWNKGYDP